MAFGLWANEAMTQKIGDATTNPQANHLGIMMENQAYVDKVFYFGSTNTAEQLQTQNNSGMDNIMITPVDALPNRVGNTAYNVGDVVEPANGGGYVYQCITAGTTAATAPSWLKTANSNTADGTVVWRCKGKRYNPSDIKLALSQADLNSAVGGAALSLGNTVKGGAAIAIYVRFMGSVSDKYDLRSKDFVSLDLNPCIVGAVS